MVYPQLPAGQTLWGYTPAISPHTPFEPCSLGSGNDGDPWLSQGPPGPPKTVSSVQCQVLVALTPPVPSSFPLASCMSGTSQLLLPTEDILSLGVQVGYVEVHSPVLRIAIQKWWSLAVLPVTLKLLLGKGRKSQKQICKPNSRRAALLSVETVGQKWRETKHASHVTAPLAWSSWEVASHCQPFCWGHFYPTLCPPFVL